MRMYVYTPQFYLRPRNTDWLYDHLLPRVSEFNPGLDVYLQQSTVCTLKENLRKAAEIAKGRLHLPLPNALLSKQDSIFSRRDVLRAKPDFIYGHSPSNIDDVPVAFNCGPTYPEVLRELGESEAFIARDIRIKQRCAARATLVVSHSHSNLDNLMTLFPEQAGKMRCLPFFLPHLEAVPEEAVAAKFTSIDRIQCLFVGREARKKALPEVLQVFQELCQRFPSRLHLKIITRFADGAVDIPEHPDIELLGEIPRDEVQRLLRQSHFLLVPSRIESYGWIYLEAMAAGCIPVAACGPNQKEILADGQAGLPTGPDPARIREGLLPYLLHPETLLPLALSAVRRCKNEYLPGVIAKRFQEIGEETISLFRSTAQTKISKEA